MPSYQTVYSASQTLLENGEVPYISGPPGIGKTSLAWDLAEHFLVGIHGEDSVKLGENFILFHPNLHDPVDVMGVPSVRDERTYWNTPAIWPDKGPVFIFVDELPQAAQAMQNALSPLFLEGRLGNWVCPQPAYIMAAGNRIEDRAATYKMPTHVANRLAHLELEFSVDDYCVWWLRQKLPEEGYSFARYMPDVVQSFDPNKVINCTPRSFASVGRLLPSLAPKTEYTICASKIGEGAATHFMAFLKTRRELPPIEQILSHPDKAKVPTDPAAMFAVVGAMVHHTDVKNFDNVLTYIERLPNEYQVVYVKDVNLKCTELRAHKRFNEWIMKNYEYIHSGADG